MKVKYIKEHNNYDLTIGKVYESSPYIVGDNWRCIFEDDNDRKVLYRKECFEIVD